MGEQGARLMQMLSAAIDPLDRPASLTPKLLELGQRHAGYGVVDGQYASLGAALPDALPAGLSLLIIGRAMSKGAR